MSTKFCRHIKASGERCRSLSLLNEIFCYYHVELERRHRRCSTRHDPAVTILHPMTLQDGSQRDPTFADPILQLDFPPLEDRHAIQVALSLAITALAENRIDPKRAALLFYGLQVASSNARQLDPVPAHNLGKVSKTTLNEATGALIAPDEDPEDPDETQDYQRKDSATRYWEMLQAERTAKDLLEAAAEAEAAAAEATATPEATVGASPALRPPLPSPPSTDPAMHKPSGNFEPSKPNLSNGFSSNSAQLFGSRSG